MGNTTKEPNKNDRRYMRTEKAIRAAFFKLAETTELDKISVSAIAREADIDRKTFYLHYASVEDFIDAEMRASANLLIEKLKESAFNSSTNDVPDLYEEISTHLALDMGSIQRITSQISFEEQIKRMEQPLIEAIVEDNIFNIDADVPNVEYYATFLTAGLLAMFRRWLLTDSSIPLESISEIAHKLIRGMYKNVSETKK